MESGSDGRSFPNSITTTSERCFEKLFGSGSKKNLNSLNFLDPLNLKFQRCNTDQKDLSFKYYLPDILKSDRNKSLEDYLSLPRVKLDDYSKSINQIISQKIEDTLKNNLQVLLVGASIGAAVTAGVALGLLVVGSVVSTSIPIWFRSLSKRVTNMYKWNGDFEERSDEFIDKSQHCDEVHRHIHRSNEVGTFKVLVLQGKPMTSLSKSTSLGDQCRDCLNSITVKLESLGLSWSEVLKLNVMIVKGDISSMRSILSEYISDLSSLTTSLIHVMGLEDSSALIEIEAWIQSKN